MEHIAAKQVSDRGLFEAVATEMIGSPRLREARHRVMSRSSACCGGPRTPGWCATTSSRRT